MDVPLLRGMLYHALNLHAGSLCTQSRAIGSRSGTAAVYRGRAVVNGGCAGSFVTLGDHCCYHCVDA